MIKLSIIIPINNLEKYLNQCLDSVVVQTLKDIEIICVNDGSTDESADIIEKFAKNDSRIKIINLQEKQGQAYARNRGIETAKGEYIGFVDGDDWIEPEMFEKLYNKAKDTDSDITMCGTKVFDEKNQSIDVEDIYYSLTNFDKTFDDKIFSHNDTDNFLLDINVAIWNKIYKKTFLDSINGRFIEGYIYEDLPFFFKTYLEASKITIVRENLYFYRTNRVGSTMNNLGRRVLDRIDMVSQTLELLKQISYYDNIKKDVIGWAINDLFHRYTLVIGKDQKEFYFLMKKLFLNLEISDLEEEFLKTLYAYKEYLLIKENSYEEFNAILFSQYKDAKIIIKDLKHENNTIYQKYDKWFEGEKAFFEIRINDNEQRLNEHQNHYNELIQNNFEHKEQQLNEQKNYYNELIQTNLYYREQQLSEQKAYYTELMQSALRNKEQDMHKSFEEKIIEQKNNYENLLHSSMSNKEYEMQKYLDEELRKQENCFNDKLLEQKNDCEKQMQLAVNNKEQETQRYFEEKLSEQQIYYENLIQTNLDNQEQKLKKMHEQQLSEQKTYYETELNHVRMLLNIVKKTKKVKNNIQNKFK